MKPRFPQVLAILLCARLTIGCGTIIHGTTQDISVASSPDNAEVWIDGAKLGSTPTKLTLKRKDSHIITIKKEGFKEATATVDNETSAWIIGNIVFGGIIGCGIDLITGGAYDLKPERLDINLTKMAELDGKTIHVPQATLDNMKEIRFTDANGMPQVTVQLTWSD